MAESLASLGSRMSSRSSRKASIEKDAVEVTSYKVTLDSDEALLRQLGYKQELRRTFTPLELFGVGMFAAMKHAAQSLKTPRSRLWDHRRRPIRSVRTVFARFHA